MPPHIDANVGESQVSYVNLRPQPTPGHRPLSLSTALKCAGTTEPRTLPDARAFVLVHQTPPPRLSVSAAPVIVRTTQEAAAGTSILPDFKIRVQSLSEADHWADTTDQHLLNWCRISVDGGLQKDAEYFSSPASLIESNSPLPLTRPHMPPLIARAFQPSTWTSSTTRRDCS